MIVCACVCMRVRACTSVQKCESSSSSVSRVRYTRVRMQACLCAFIHMHVCVCVCVRTRMHAWHAFDPYLALIVLLQKLVECGVCDLEGRQLHPVPAHSLQGVVQGVSLCCCGAVVGVWCSQAASTMIHGITSGVCWQCGYMYAVECALVRI
jgi:hypothetical protein